jgi:hypothetical protein
MPKMQKKALSTPDEKRSFDKGQLELVTLGGVTFARVTFSTGMETVQLCKTDREDRNLSG